MPLSKANPHKKYGSLIGKLAVLFRLSVVAIAVVACATACSPASAQDSVLLTPEEKLWLKKNDGKITLAPCPNYPPVDFVDETGQETGISQDFIHLIEKRLGFHFKTVNFQTWAEVQEAGKRGEVDAVTTVQKTQGREKYWRFTKPYVTYQTVIITSNRIQRQLSLDKLSGLRVAMVENYAISEHLAKQHPDLNLILVPNDRAGIHRVSAGDIDVMIADLPTAAYFIEKEGITNLRIAGETGQFFQLSIATRKDLPILNRILDKALGTITPAERAKILERWVGVRIVRPFDWRLAWIITASVLLVVSAMLIWNIALRRRVRAQAQQLIKTNIELSQTLQALGQSEARFRSIVQNMPGVVYQMRVKEDGSSYFSYISPRAADILGMSNDPTHPDWELGRLIHPDDLDSFWESINTAIDNQAQWDWEGRLVPPDGTTSYFNWVSSPTRIDNQLVFDGILLDISEKRQAEDEKRQFYRDTISSVTDGKLLIGSESDLENYTSRANLKIDINTYEDTVAARQKLANYFSEHGISKDDLHLFITGLGEAMTNAIKHAGGGKVFTETNGTLVWAGVADVGPGIAAVAIPQATLKRGHSTKISMGMGYSIMLEASDHIVLCTGSQGTTVILVKDPARDRHIIKLEDLPDTW